MVLDTKEHLSSYTRSSIWWFVPLAFLLLAGALCIFKTFYGFDWSDETCSSALPYRFLIGDSLFGNAWDTHQTGALITLPLVLFARIAIGASYNIK